MKFKAKNVIVDCSSPCRDVDGRGVTFMWIAVSFIAATALFSFVPNTFFNYGYDYYQFLSWMWLGVPIVLCMADWLVGRYTVNVSSRFLIAAALVFALAFPVLCWLFRTRVHCFGGDGAVGIVGGIEFSINDWIPSMPGKGRLDGYGSGFVAKCCRHMGLFEDSSVMTSILSTQAYAVLMGFFFVVIALIAFHKRLDIFAVLMTLPFAFNFFGNVDNYTFSLVMGLVILIAFAKVEKCETVRFGLLVGLGILWGIGMWTHPFHVFWGFPLSHLFARWLRRFNKFGRLPIWLPTVLFGMVLFASIKSSSFGNHWFLWEFAKLPPTFSVDTFTHYLNMILLPSLPLLAGLLMGNHDREIAKTAIVQFAAASACFFTMGFTIGAVDQLNYQHLLFLIIAPLVLAIDKMKLSRNVIIGIVLCNLSLLIPMIVVHSSARTVDRAQALYPIDPCQHNRCMSWQTHLGLCLGDNLQDSPAVKKATLRAFESGARHAEPAGFRGGNYIYHTAFLYHFGEFARGRQQLAGLMKQDPTVVRYFLSTRPGFAYMNRQRLWDDLYELFPECPAKAQLKQTLDGLRAQAQKERYCLRNPKYAVCPY